MKTLSLLLALSFIATTAQSAQALTKNNRKVSQMRIADDVDTLGGNEDLMRKAQALKSQTRVRIVQDRIVDRRNKLEFAMSFGGVMGGDSYLQTQSLGLTANYHFTPRWSLGVQYSDYTSSLTPEGKRVFNKYREDYAAGGRPGYAVDVDYPLHSTMAVINWYPIYGKTSFLDMGVTQFDLYLIGGAGQIQLSSGSSAIYSAGIGMGAWLSRHVSMRAEVKYQSYEDRPVTGSRTLNTGAANIGIGWIL